MVSQLQTVSRGDGIPAFNIGVGPVGANVKQAGMLLDTFGHVYAVEAGTKVSWQGGIGFDVNGRMSIAPIVNPVAIQSSGATPFDANGDLCIGGNTLLIYMGVALSLDGKISIT